MRAESAGEGQGSTFTVNLPVREANTRTPVSVPVIQRRNDHRALFLAAAHILILDDEADARDLLRAMLENSGARITEADTVEQALRTIAADRPDLLLADIAMPHQDGYAMIRAIRGSEDGKHIPAIAVSAYARREDQQRALDAGYDGHVAKPVQPAQLMDVIERVWIGRTGPLMPDTDSDASIH
jgi:CheY-like chemotaxis protein